MKAFFTFTIAALLLLIHSGCSMHQTQAAANKPKISVQLHSVKDVIQDDFEATIKALASAGVNGVEFAGRFGPYKDDPAALKQFLNTLNIEASGAHVSIKSLRGDALADTISFYKTLGASLLIIPHDKRANNPYQVQELAEELSSIATALTKEGMTLGYHNHAMEFTPFNGETFWDYIAQNTPETMALQLDIGWSNFAGMNAIKYIERYPQRTLSSHIKIRTTANKAEWADIDRDKAIIVGQDNFDWPQVFTTMMVSGGTQWLVVEQEETYKGQTRLEAVTASIKGVKRILAAI